MVWSFSSAVLYLQGRLWAQLILCRWLRCLRASAFGEELGDGERGLCAPVLGVLILHLLP